MQLYKHSSRKPESNRKPRVEKLTVSDRVCKRFSIQRCFTVRLLHLTKKKTNAQNAETHCSKMMTAQMLNTVRYRNLPGNKPSTWILNVQKAQTHLRNWQTLSFIQVTSTKCAREVFLRDRCSPWCSSWCIQLCSSGSESVYKHTIQRKSSQLPQRAHSQLLRVKMSLVYNVQWGIEISHTECMDGEHDTVRWREVNACSLCACCCSHKPQDVFSQRRQSTGEEDLYWSHGGEMWPGTNVR